MRSAIGNSVESAHTRECVIQDSIPLQHCIRIRATTTVAALVSVRDCNRTATQPATVQTHGRIGFRAEPMQYRAALSRPGKGNDCDSSSHRNKGSASFVNDSLVIPDLYQIRYRTFVLLLPVAVAAAIPQCP